MVGCALLLPRARQRFGGSAPGPRPLRERQHVQRDQVDQGHDHEQAEPARKSGLGEDLPEQLDEAALTEIVERKIAELGATGPQSMGQVIGAVKAEVGNKADGATLANIVKNTLSK